MMMLSGSRCQVKGVLTACGADATAMCVYCGRTFCARHGVVLEDGAEVCTRRNCVAKMDDLAVHVAYKDAVLERNLQRLCGLEFCTMAIQVKCNRCGGYFCIGHTHAWTETVTERPERTCRHCLERRPVWDRE